MYVVEVFVISVGLVNAALFALCHLTTVPVCPANVNNPELLPEQIVEPPVTVPPTVKGLTVIVIELDVALGELTQGLLDTISQVTTSLFANVLEANVEVVTALIPFTFHW